MTRDQEHQSKHKSQWANWIKLFKTQWSQIDEQTNGCSSLFSGIFAVGPAQYIHHYMQRPPIMPRHATCSQSAFTAITFWDAHVTFK